MEARGRDEPLAVLTGLGRPIGPEREERLVRSIMARVAPELRRRAARLGAIASLAAVARPAVAAAALILLASAMAIGTAAGRGTLVPRLLADGEEMATPSGQAETWVVEGRRPSVDDLLSALHEEPR